LQLSSPPLFKQGTPALIKLAVCLLLSIVLMVVDFQFNAMAPIRSVASYLLTPIESLMLLPRNISIGTYEYLTSKGSL
jgi:rod shape-determining protein MreC